MSVTQDNREVKINTPLGKDVLLLRSMRMSEELGRLFNIEVELLSPSEDIKFEELLGQNVTIELNVINDKKRYFNGHISRFSQSGSEGGYAVYQATIHPWLWFLTRTADCRIFQKKSVPEIVTEIFRELKHIDFELKLFDRKYRTLDYCVQYRETDFNFVSRLLEQEGIYYYFKHESDKHILYLSDNIGAHDPLPSNNKIPFYPPDDTVVRDEEHISSWFLSKQLQPGKYELNEFDFEKPRDKLISKAAIIRDYALSKYEIYDYPGEYIKTDEGKDYAQARIEELHTQYEQAQGQGNVRELQTGSLFTLKEYPREDQNREYLITQTNHIIHSDIFGSGSNDGGRALYSNSFSAIDSKTAFRAARITPKPIIQGAQTAIVVGSSGKEIHTEKHGRVKLQFHWDRYGESNQKSSCWVRVSQVHAGKGFGGIDIPRVGEEVIVSFEEGDPDRPLVTGRVYNGDNKAPNGLPSKGMVSGLKSNTTPGGGGNNSIMLDDTKEKEKFSIHAQHDMDTTVEHDHSITVNTGNDTHTVVAGTRSVTVKKDTTLTVQAGKREVTVTGGDHSTTSTDNSVNITGKKSVMVEGETENVGLKGKGDIGIKLQGEPTVDIEGKSTVLVRAPLVDVGDDEVLIKGNKITLQCGGSTIEILPTKIILSSGSGSLVLDATGATLNGAVVKIN